MYRTACSAWAIIVSTKSSNQVKEAHVSVSGGAGEIAIGSDDNTSLLRAALESNITTLSQKSTTTGSRQYASIALDSSERWWLGNYKNKLNVTLAEILPMHLRIDAGASDIHGDLSQVDLRRLTVKSGASSSEFRLGTKADTTDVDIDIGVASITLLLPKSSGVSMRVDSGLSSNDTTGLREVSDGYYESESYATADKKINIRGQIGMSSLDIRYY